MEDFKVVIAGGRDFKDFTLLCNTMDFLLKEKVKTHNITIISGGARGADNLAKLYARLRGFNLVVMNADWDTHDKAAGFIRNKQMADYTNVVVCFWDNKSRGTKHMIDITTKAGKPLRVINY